MTPGVAVTLTWAEVYVGALVGLRRALRGYAFGRRSKWDDDGSCWQDNIVGALGELAYAKALGRYWCASDRLDYDGDVGPVQVRTTHYTRGHLLVYPGDPDTQTLVLVAGVVPELRVVGAILAADAKRESWWRETARDSGWWVPQAALGPLP